MRTRQGLEPNLGLSEALYPAKGMLDMGAATARGVTRGTLGLPGDLESLMRMIVGGNQILPTSEDFDKKLTKGTYLSAPDTKQRSPFDDLGVFYNVPIYGGAIGAAGKGIKKLGGKMVGGETNLGRREFAKKAGAIGLGSTALMKAIKYLDELETAAKPAAKIPDGWDKVDGSGYVHATKAVPKYKYNSLKEYNDALKDRAMAETDIHFSELGHDGYSGKDYEPELLKRYSQIAKEDEIDYNSNKWMSKTYNEPGRKLNNLQTRLRDNANKYLEENSFSPQAKAEMREFKALVNNSNKNKPNWFGEGDGIVNWTDELDNYANWLRVDEVPF